MRSKVQACVGGLLFVASSLTMSVTAVAPPAGAATCFVGLECHADVRWSTPAPTGTLGAKVTLRSNCMGIADTSTDAIYQALFVRDDDTNYALEAGYVRGENRYNGVTYNTPRRYVYYESPDGHLTMSTNSYSYNTALTATIYKSSTSSSTWQMWFGNSTSHVLAPYTFSGAAEFMSAGMYSTDDTSESFGSVSRLYFYNLGAVITPEWLGSTSTSFTSFSGTYGSPFASYFTTNYWWAQMSENGTC